MFIRIMSMVLAAIILVTGGLTLVCGIVMKNQQIDSRLAYLTGEAEEIAYLASQVYENNNIFFARSWQQQNTARELLNRKAGKVNDEFGAYIAVVDRRGTLMDNMRVTFREDPDFAASLSSKEITDALKKILNGESIFVRTTINGAPMFTVGVPYISNKVVQGAVFIQTKAQMVETDFFEIVKKFLPVAFATSLLGVFCVFWYVRGTLKPLKALTKASQSMAEGKFDVRVPENTGDKDIRNVGSAFNLMADKLDNVERNRREFVANVSHELRSPITSIKGFAEGMAEGVIPPEEHPRYLQLVAQESNRLSGLIDSLLALSRLEREDAKPEYSDFDLNELFRMAVIRRMNTLDEKELEVECEFDAEPCAVSADKDRIEQVVINLLDNAIRFTPKGGRITLHTGEKDGKCVAVVRDNGIGILPEDRDKIFDRFFTADRAHTSGKGTGLGLSICQRIMEMHGETIRLLDSDEGAAFMFTLKKSTLKGAIQDGTAGSENNAE